MIVLQNSAFAWSLGLLALLGDGYSRECQAIALHISGLVLLAGLYFMFSRVMILCFSKNWFSILDLELGHEGQAHWEVTAFWNDNVLGLSHLNRFLVLLDSISVSLSNRGTIKTAF